MIYHVFNWKISTISQNLYPQVLALHALTVVKSFKENILEWLVCVLHLQYKLMPNVVVSLFFLVS